MTKMSVGTNFDTDIASRMLSALVMESTGPCSERDNIVHIDDQKRYLQRWIDSISVDDRKSIGNILVMNNKRSLLIECSEGTVINLDLLSPQIIDQMYDLMLYKRERRARGN